MCYTVNEQLFIDDGAITEVFSNAETKRSGVIQRFAGSQKTLATRFHHDRAYDDITNSFRLHS